MNETIFQDSFSKEVFEQNYQYGDETINDTHERIARSLAEVEKDKDAWIDKFKWILSEFKFVPGGRIISNVGTELKGTTAINCFVDGFVGQDQDSMEGILDALRRQALILKSEGGYGFCVDVLRPRGAFIEGIGSTTPGAVEMLSMWNTQSTVITKGSGKKIKVKKSKKKIRKGAQMVTMSCWHPDVVEFITAKQVSGKLSKFNMSVLITDEFMDAVKKHKPWNLEFPDYENPRNLEDIIDMHGTIPLPSVKEVYKEHWDGNLKKWKEGDLPTKIYKTFDDANELWDLIMQSTYNRNEPGVLFVDTINKWNNLWYEEYISATNPCGEQILPVGGVCLLGSLNLTQFVKGNDWDYDKLKEVIPVAIRLMDNVNDITYVPLEIQQENLKSKRRVGLGIMGYGSALMMLKVRYGSKKALELTKNLMDFMMNTAYQSSALLAKEKSSFPLFDLEKYLDSAFIANLSGETIKMIEEYGMRNSHLLSVQPTGNTSVLANVVSGGLEPVFLPEYTRTSIQPYPPEGMYVPTVDWKEKKFDISEDTDWTWVKEGDESMLRTEFNGDVWKLDEGRGLLKEVVCKEYAVRYLQDQKKWNPDAKWVSHMGNLTIDDHVKTMTVIAKYIDSAMSKTINLPNDYSYEDFKSIYTKLYDSGVVKGGTTYRAGTMASVLKKKDDGRKDTIEVMIRNGRIIKNAAPKRPPVIGCDIIHTTALGKQWVVLVGMLYDEPYEVFAFRKERINLSPRIISGKTHKVRSGQYNLEIPDVVTFEDITTLFNKSEHEALTRLISTALRHGIDPLFIFEQLDKSEGTIQSFSKAIGRTLKKYIKRPPTDTKCPNCNAMDGLIFAEGCIKCKECGWGEC